MRKPPIWTIVGLFTLAYWGTSTDPQYPLILVEFLSGRFEIGKLAASMPIITASLGAIVGTLTAGFLARRLGIGTLIYFNMWCFVGCAYLNTLDAPLWVFDVTRGLTGFCQGGLALLFLLGIGVLVPEVRRGFAVGVLSAGAMMAVAAVPLLIMATRPPGDHWHMPFWAFGGAVFIAVLGLHAVRMPRRPETSHDAASPWTLLRDPNMLRLLALGGMLLVSIVAMGSQFSVFAKERFDLDIHQMIPQMITLGVGAVTGALVAGKLTDRLGPRPILLWSSLAVAIFFVLVSPLASRAWAVYPVFFLMSALAAARVPPYQALMLRVIPEEVRGQVLGIRNVISYAGTGIGAGGGALLYQMIGSYQAVAIFAAVVGVLALWIIVISVPRSLTATTAR